MSLLYSAVFSQVSFLLIGQAGDPALVYALVVWVQPFTVHFANCKSATHIYWIFFCIVK